MPISSIGSYVTTADQIIAHGTDVNADRVANALPELAMQGGYLLGDFITDRDALETAIIGLEGLENARDIATGDRDLQKANLSERLRQFRAAAEIHFKKTTYFRAVPTIPNLSINETRFMRSFDHSS